MKGLNKYVWSKDHGLVQTIGYSNTLMAKDGRPFVLISRCHTSDKIAYYSHPDNFYPISDGGKLIILGRKEEL